jgi:glucosamine--fructose-6-phosphate aminotransferase (isomerizing)
MISTDVFPKPRTHTLDEIFSQPHCWSLCLSHVAANPALVAASRLMKPGAEWTFIGCGSSYYLALAAASTFSHLGLLARALPASEVLLYPDLAMPKNRAYIPVMISRSGLTSEVLAVTRMLEKERNVRTVAITCGSGQGLESLASVVLKLPEADETSTVMTRSFTSMLLGLQYLGATLSGVKGFAHALMQLPEQVLPLVEETAARLSAFVQSHVLADYVFLAQGPLFGIANEAMLKMTECSCSYAQVFHSLEFRHGPKSIAGPGTLIAFFMSETSYESELEVLREMKHLGATTFAVANVVDVRTRQVADFFIELGLETPECARLAAYAIWGQFFGVYTGLKKGLNPDSPKNLTRVVILDGQP